MDETPLRCRASILPPGAWRSHQCSKPANGQRALRVAPSGTALLPVCGQHRDMTPMPSAYAPGSKFQTPVSEHVTPRFVGHASRNGQHGHANTGFALASGFFGAGIASYFGGLAEVALFLTIAALLTSVSALFDNLDRAKRGW